MSLGRTILPRIAVVALLASCLVAVVPGPANAGQLTLRKCTSDTNDDILRGDGQRKLSVCSRGWVNGNPASTRGVVELHTYALVQGIWQDSRSQSISLQLARVERLDPRDFWVTEIAYGQERGGNCRVNGSGGSVGCSVANVTAVDFYGPAVAAGVGEPYRNVTSRVSWRDDQGFPHTVTIKVKPDGGPLISPTWRA